MEQSTAISAYAAVVSTGVAVWNLWTWWHDRRLRLSGCAVPNMAGPDGQTYITFRIVNRGPVPTEMHTVYLRSYANRWQWLRGREQRRLLIQPHPLAHRTPYKLERPGEFAALILQTDDVVTLSKSSLLYAVAVHTMGKPFGVRVKPIEEVPPNRRGIIT